MAGQRALLAPTLKWRAGVVRASRSRRAPQTRKFKPSLVSVGSAALVPAFKELLAGH